MGNFKDIMKHENFILISAIIFSSQRNIKLLKENTEKLMRFYRMLGGCLRWFYPSFLFL